MFTKEYDSQGFKNVNDNELWVWVPSEAQAKIIYSGSVNTDAQKYGGSVEEIAFKKEF